MAEKAPTADASLGSILGDLVENTQTLVRQEVALVRAKTTEDIKETATEKGRAVGLLIGGGIFAIIGLALLGATLIFGLTTWFALATWLSAAIVTLIYFVIAAVLALLGRNMLSGGDDEEEVTA